MGYFGNIQKCKPKKLHLLLINSVKKTVCAGLFYHSTILPAELTVLFELSQACHGMWESVP